MKPVTINHAYLMMADTLVLYIESMPCEVGAAALA